MLRIEDDPTLQHEADDLYRRLLAVVVRRGTTARSDRRPAVLALLVAGCSASEIARALHCSVASVCQQRTVIRRVVRRYLNQQAAIPTPGAP